MASEAVERVSFSLQSSTLETLRDTLDRACNITPARIAQEMMTSGSRKAAIETLRGEPVNSHVAKDGDVILDRTLRPTGHGITPTIKKKRRSGRSNWPNTKEGRARVDQRTLEIRAHPGGATKNLLQTTGEGSYRTTNDKNALDTDYILNATESAAMQALTTQVATRLGVPAHTLANPLATIAMCASGTPTYQGPQGDAPHRIVRVVLDSDTQPPLKFKAGALASRAPLRAGEALIFDSSVAHTFRRADWQSALAFRVL